MSAPRRPPVVSLRRPPVTPGAWVCRAGRWGLVQTVIWTGAGWALTVVALGPLESVTWAAGECMGAAGAAGTEAAA